MLYFWALFYCSSLWTVHYELSVPRSIFSMGITKPCTHLHQAHFNLHPAPSSSFKRPPSSLQQSQHYKNQNIACNWAICPNVGQKFKVVLFAFKLAHMVYWRCKSRLRISKFQPQKSFFGKFRPKIQSYPFCLKIGTHGGVDSESRLRILKFWPQNHFLGKFGPKK